MTSPSRTKEIVASVAERLSRELDIVRGSSATQSVDNSTGSTMDDDKMAVLAARAWEVSKQLNEATDELNRQIHRLQRVFAAKFSERTARVTLRHPLEPKDGYVEDLIFKSNRFWVEMGMPGKLQLLPLLNCPRDIRMDSVYHFQELLEACHKAV